MQSRFQAVDTEWTVVDQTGDKIGDVTEVGSNYVLVTKGLIFPKDVYIPASHVSDLDEQQRAVVVSVSKDDIESMGWDQPPQDDAYEAGDAYRTGDAYAAGDAYTAGDTDTAGTETRDESVTVPLREERLEAERRQREVGDVTVGKHVVDERQELDVPVTRDEVEVTRRRVDRDARGDEGPIADGDTVRIPVTAEEVDVSRRDRVVEEVEVSKRPVTETQRVSETVRREEVDVDEHGNVLAGSGTQRAVRSDFDDEGNADRVRGSRLDEDEEGLR